MIYVLGFTQFVLLSLGILALNILSKVSDPSNALTPLATALVRSGLWLFVIPFLWLVFANCVSYFLADRAANMMIKTSGGLVIAAIVLCFGTAIFMAVT